MKKDRLISIFGFLGFIVVVGIVGAVIGALFGVISYFATQYFGIASIGIMAFVGAVIFFIIWIKWIFKT